MYMRPELTDGDRVAVHQVSKYDIDHVVIIHHVCVGNGRMWSQRATCSTPEWGDTEMLWSKPEDLTNRVAWDQDEGIFYIN